MFFTGIFTTNLPYIMVLSFYAYFLIFGIEKASNGEVDSDGYLKIEIETETYLAYGNCNSIYYFNNNYDRAGTVFLENHVLECKLKHPDFIYLQHSWQDCNDYFIFSRPPPLA
ncbi:MAG: hypothetical protein L3J54_12670 [Draconibacterium sp.]|nr:hypothetical protein [Draconibacterium sp.]